MLRTSSSRSAGPLLLALLILLPLVFVTPSSSAVGEPIRLGSSFRYWSGNDVQSQVLALESKLGRGQLSTVRLYHAWDEWFPQPGERFLRNAGRDTLPVVSIDTTRRNGQRVWWKHLAEAKHGSRLHDELIRWVEDLKAYGKPIIVSLNHEPDFYRNGGTGSPWYYKKAYEKFVWILRNRGATNVRTAFIGVAWNFDSRSSTRAEDYYPGDHWIDVLGADGYNWWTCNGSGPYWRSADQVFDAFRRWTLSHPGKPLMIAEVGSAEDHAKFGWRKRQWMQQFAADFSQPKWNRLEVVTWWNQIHESHAGCDFRIGSSWAATEGMKDMLRTARFD